MYIDGREPYPWPTILRDMGLQMVPDSVPRIGVTSAADPSGAVRVVDLLRVVARTWQACTSATNW